MIMSISPRFPLRVIFNDGEVIDIAEPEQLLAQFASGVDTEQERDHFWIRDAEDRTVRLQMNDGYVVLMDVVP
jgi:hypothetical protein